LTGRGIEEGEEWIVAVSPECPGDTPSIENPGNANNNEKAASTKLRGYRG